LDIFGDDSSSDDGLDSSQPAWVQHPPASAPLELMFKMVLSVETDGGAGLQATSSIPANTEFHREAPALRCPNGHPAESYEEALQLHRACVESRFNLLPPSTQADLRLLFALPAYNNADNEPDSYGIYQTNSVRLTGPDKADGGVFLTHCRMNHSCEPNVTHIWRSDLQMLTLITIRDIEVGEELYTTYGGLSGVHGMNSTKARREHLMKEFGFHCMCSLCKAEDDKDKKADDKAKVEQWEREEQERGLVENEDDLIYVMNGL